MKYGDAMDGGAMTGNVAKARPAPLVVLNVVGLTPRLVAHMPNLQTIAAAGFQAMLGPVLPAVTCSVQASLLTGALAPDTKTP